MPSAFDLDPDAGGILDRRKFLYPHAHCPDPVIGERNGGNPFGERFDQIDVSGLQHRLDSLDDTLVTDDIVQPVTMIAIVHDLHVNIDAHRLSLRAFMVEGPDGGMPNKVTHKDVAYLPAGIGEHHRVQARGVAVHLSSILLSRSAAQSRRLGLAAACCHIRGHPGKMLTAVQRQHLAGHRARLQQKTDGFGNFRRIDGPA